METVYFEKDIYLIHRLAFPHLNVKIFILDPEKKLVRNLNHRMIIPVRTRKDIEFVKSYNRPHTLINISGAQTFSFPFSFEKISGIITFNQYPEVSELFYHYELYYSCNSKEQISWLYDKNYRDHDFLLHLEEISTTVDINNLWTFFPDSLKYLRLWLGDLKRISSGLVQILIPEKHEFLSQLNKGESISIPLYKARKTGVITIFIKKGKKVIRIIKIPSDPLEKDILKHDVEIIQNQEKELIRPESRKNYSEYHCSRPVRVLSHYKLHSKYREPFIRKVLDYNIHYLRHQALEDFLKKNDVIKSLDFIKLRLKSRAIPQGLGLYNFTFVFKHITALLNELKHDSHIPVSYSNPNLSPENIFSDGQNICLLHWEHYNQNYPLIYDLFDWIFKEEESKEDPDAENLAEDLQWLSEELSPFMEKHELSFDFDKLLKLYLLTRFSREMFFMLNNPRIIPEENMKIYLWAEWFKLQEA